LVSWTIFANDSQRVMHRGVLKQQRLDLAQLDSKAANFHLVVHAPKEFSAIRQIPNPISRAVGASRT
jgi:hypothetical protein